MTYAFKITVNQDKNNGQQNQPIVFEEPVLDFCVDGREFFLASYSSEIEASRNVTIENPSGTDEIKEILSLKACLQNQSKYAKEGHMSWKHAIFEC